MLIKVAKQITDISDIKEINSSNYFEALSYINNIYLLINKLKMVVPMSSISFIPTFKGRFTCEKYNIASNDYENEMRLFIIESDMFLEDNEIKKEIRNIFTEYIDSIIFDGRRIEILLKEMNNRGVL